MTSGGERTLEDEASLARSDAGAFVSGAGDVVISCGRVYSLVGDAMLSFRHLRDIHRQKMISNSLKSFNIFSNKKQACEIYPRVNVLVFLKSLVFSFLHHRKQKLNIYY